MALNPKETARRLRKESTPAENLLWPFLRNRRLSGKKINRQFPIEFYDEGKRRFYVADFYCHEYRLVIELDGPIHDSQQERDKIRTEDLKKLGYKVIRFKNEEVEENVYKVLAGIKEHF